MYGNLQITSSKAVLTPALTRPQNNSVIKEGSLSTVAFKILPQSHPEDANEVVTMITNTTSTTGYGTIVLYCGELENLIFHLKDYSPVLTILPSLSSKRRTTTLGWITL